MGIYEELQARGLIAHVYGWNEVFEVLLGSVISQMRKITMTHAIKIIHTWNQIPIWR